MELKKTSKFISFSKMRLWMKSSGCNLKVFVSVVIGDMVFVVNKLVSLKIPSDSFFHNETMLEDISSRRRVRMVRRQDVNISTSVYASAFKVSVLRSFVEIVKTSFGTKSEFASFVQSLRAIKLFPAIFTGMSNDCHGDILTDYMEAVNICLL